jgi:hypothetical protein
MNRATLKFGAYDCWLLEKACTVAKARASDRTQHDQLERLRRIAENAAARCREKDRRDERHREVQKGPCRRSRGTSRCHEPRHCAILLCEAHADLVSR